MTRPFTRRVPHLRKRCGKADRVHIARRGSSSRGSSLLNAALAPDADSMASVDGTSRGGVLGNSGTDPFAPLRMTCGSFARFPFGKVPTTSRA